MQAVQKGRHRTAIWSAVLFAACCLALPVLAAEEPPVEPININSATAEELTALPGVGPAIAARIVEYRQKNGPFTKTVELMNVSGIGEKTFDRLKNSITVQNTDAP